MNNSPLSHGSLTGYNNSTLMISMIDEEQEKKWDELLLTDPVCLFCERVNKRAVADSLWKTNYALAHYRAFVDEAQENLAVKLGIKLE